MTTNARTIFGLIQAENILIFASFSSSSVKFRWDVQVLERGEFP